ncbi:MAG: LuxR family transcriptional regulator [Polyangiaceae bacterium]
MSEAAPRHEVWARVARAAIELAVRGGASAETLTAGLPFDAEGLHALRRVAWEDYCVMVERMEVEVGGPEALDDLLATGYHQVLPEIRAVAGALVSPRLLVSFITEVIDPVVFGAVECLYEDLGVDRVRATLRLRPGARPCAVWFRGNAAALRGIPRHLGLPEAEVVADTGPSHGIYEIRLPASATLVASAGRAARSMLERVFGMVGDGHGTIAASVVDAGAGAPRGFLPPDALWRLDAATGAWDLTRRQREVLQYLALGEANKEIAHALSCAENTVELHVTQILRKAGAPSRAKLIARFWSEL